MTIARGSPQSRYLNNFAAKNDVLPSVSSCWIVLAREAEAMDQAPFGAQDTFKSNPSKSVG
jgi:hypothetical protein